MDLREEESTNLQERNEILAKILKEWGMDINNVSAFTRELIEVMPLAYYDKRALNSLKHGMNMKKILPCKLGNCIYSEQCVIYQNTDISDIEIGSPCRLEIDQYLEIVESIAGQYVDQESSPPMDVLAEYIMGQIMNDRNRRLIAQEGGFVPRPGVPRQNNNGLSLGFRYWTSLRSSTNKVIEKLITKQI